MRTKLFISTLTITLATTLALPGLSAHASTFGAADGAYKTVNVSKASDCPTLCKADKKCRGAMTYIPDTRYEAAVCHLHDGLQAGSPFEIKPPKPLDMRQALNDLNTYRARHGLRPVTLNQTLNQASKIHAQDLARHGIIAHEGTDGSTHADRVQRLGYKFWVAAENVATGQKSWEEAFEGWQKSPGHNENLLRDDVSEFGIALVYEPTTTYITYWAMLVAEPQNLPLER